MDIRQCTATTRKQAEVLKEVLQWSGERKCKVTSIKPHWQANWTYNATTSLSLNDTFLRGTTYLEKTVNMNWLLILLSVTTIADAFLHKARSGRMTNYPLYDAIHETSRLYKRATHASAQRPPKAHVYWTGFPNFL